MVKNRLMFARQPRVTESYLCICARSPQYDIHTCLLPAWILIYRQWRRMHKCHKGLV